MFKLNISKFTQFNNEVAVFLYIILISVGYASTSESSIIYISIIRLAAIFSIVIYLVWLMAMRLLRIDVFLSFTFYLLLILYSSLLSALNIRNDLLTWDKITIDIVVTFVGSIILMANHESVINTKAAKLIVLYVLFMFTLTIIVGGFGFEFPPRFNFDGISPSGSVVGYSQGTSKFYAIGTICSVYIIATASAYYTKIIYFILAIIFAFLTILGGARGDSLAMFIVVSLYILFIAPAKFIMTSTIILIISSVFINDWSILEMFTLYSRLMVLDESNLGMRDILFYQSIELVSNEIPCMLIGCGLNYFQNYYGHEFGMYPHNYLSESIISFGLFITIGMIIAIILGFLIYLRSETKSTLFILLLGYFLIVALKGGYFIGHWFVNASFIFFLCYIFKIAHLNMKRKIIVPS